LSDQAVAPALSTSTDVNNNLAGCPTSGSASMRMFNLSEREPLGIQETPDLACFDQLGKLRPVSVPDAGLKTS
jgi:hypothetical protein